MGEWIDRTAALERLGVKQQTLYAYVSRGQIGMMPDPADPRRSFYRADDVEGLRTRRSRGRARAAVATSTIAWGEPSMDTTISTVRQGRLLYRGRDAVTLAATATWEEAAALLWDCERPVRLAAAPSAPDPFVAVAALVRGGYPTVGRGRDRLLADAEHAISVLASALGAVADTGPLHVRLAIGWRAERFAEPIRRALVLLADHELNASSFAVRVAASTGAPIAACLLGGLATLSGPRHGAAGAAAVALLDEARRRGVHATLTRYLGDGRVLPGFDHPLYPSGDPRATALLRSLPRDELLEQVRAQALDEAGSYPNIDFALAALTAAAGLPDDAPFRLFALGRSAGWCAQAFEQIETGTLIRTRARYVGQLPD